MQAGRREAKRPPRALPALRRSSLVERKPRRVRGRLRSWRCRAVRQWAREAACLLFGPPLPRAELDGVSGRRVPPQNLPARRGQLGGGPGGGRGESAASGGEASV